MASSSSSSGANLDELLDDKATTSWEAPMTRSWETIEEDEKGELKSQQIDDQRSRKRKLLATQTRIVEKGVIRYLYLILDLSNAMEESDLKPNRRLLSINYIEQFILEYFDQNPISQLGLIVAHDGKAEKLTSLSGNPKQQSEILKSYKGKGGVFSLQNSLNVAKTVLCNIPAYGSREVLIIMGALSSCDPDDIEQTIASMKQTKIRCSVIGLSAEIHVCSVLAAATGGTYRVALNKDHFREILMNYVVPIPAESDQRVGRKWIKMGFPEQRIDKYDTLCACHKAYSSSGYYCPNCLTKFCELPTQCVVCGLTLISSPHLARSYHHLFVIPAYVELDSKERWKGQCHACQVDLDSSTALALQCPKCKQIFCIECDVFVHSSLHNCPGCTSNLS
eukprot:TRINITY_DN3414_c0_g1_i1.p1 TRINITY_DN3414_c0_g1~~TRINITY_DN3414_c0_g1_i1.p1  ORF type:complete len:393 (-),score=52.69 TRINITY_DN3414_c0_g1_i1:344-1522(-)